MKIIQEGGVTSALGYVAAGVKAGIKASGKLDMAVIYSQAPAVAAGAFTRNAVRAAPVQVSEAHLKDCKVRAVVINSGNANACTGEAGIHNARTMCEVVANGLNLATDEVAVASTGIIGVQLPMDKIIAGATAALDQLSRDGANATQAIMTTDLTQKHIAVEVMINGHIVTIGGIAKGSGMIHPNMATMLGFITTDANISSSLLQELLSELTEVTFNQITIDGDTSTNDMVLVMANGMSGMPEIQKDAPEFAKFKAMFTQVLTDLAKMIAKDGEGATKLIETIVTGAKNVSDARMLAKSVVGSSLVKSAIFGQDPNWGRILCALGYSGVVFDPETIQIYLADTLVFENGQPTIFDANQLSESLKTAEVVIQVVLSDGSASSRAWGCDLTYEYVKINALYHT